MYQEKAEAAGEEYEQFKGTFKTVNDINDIKIRVEKGEMKDSARRFDLQSARAKIKAFSGNGMSVYFIVAIAGGFFYTFMLRMQNSKENREMKNSLENQEGKQTKRRIFD